jgi:hypothetical protein
MSSVGQQEELTGDMPRRSKPARYLNDKETT